MVTRSGKSGEQLVERLQSSEMKAFYIPTLEIKAENILLPIEDFQQAIFVSPNAVKYGVEKNQALKDILPNELIAVGQGTAACLHEAGYQQIIVPDEYNSEGLLKLPQLQEVKGQQILIVKGRGGRAFLGDKLTEKGAICHYLEVYCRVSSQIDDQLWQQFLNTAEHRFITIASVDAMKALSCNLSQDFDYNQLTLVVASQRIRENAIQLGYKHISVAKSASNDDMYQAITSLVKAIK